MRADKLLNLIIARHIRALAKVVFVSLVVKLLGEGDNLAVVIYELDGLALQFGEDGHGFLFGEIPTEGFQQQVVGYGDGAVVGVKG